MKWNNGEHSFISLIKGPRVFLGIIGPFHSACHSAYTRPCFYSPEHRSLWLLGWLEICSVYDTFWGPLDITGTPSKWPSNVSGTWRNLIPWGSTIHTSTWKRGKALKVYNQNGCRERVWGSLVKKSPSPRMPETMESQENQGTQPPTKPPEEI